MKNTVTKIALALLAVITMTGCPGKKKNNNQFVSPPGYQSGYSQYNGTYCDQISLIEQVAIKFLSFALLHKNL